MIVVKLLVATVENLVESPRSSKTAIHINFTDTILIVSTKLQMSQLCVTTDC